jgi:hypothetical protein
MARANWSATNVALPFSTSMLTRRQAVGAFERAAPGFVSSFSRASSIAAIWRRRFHNHFNCRRRMARSLATRSSLWTKT